MSNSNESPLGKIFAVIGFIAGLAAGSESGGEAAFIAAIILAAVGYTIGKFVEWLLAKVIFVALVIIMFLINTGIRQALWQAISG